MFDLHCHLLPQLDDGPSTEEEAIALAREQVACGVFSAVATPHVNHVYPNRPHEIGAAVRRLRAALAEADVPLEVLSGAEIQATVAEQLSDDELHELTLGNSKWLLIEPPITFALHGFERVVYELHARGHRVIIAHPERSPLFLRDVGLLERLVLAGALAQTTASAYSGHFGAPVRRAAIEMTGKGLIHLVASDAHGTMSRRPGLAAHLTRAGFGGHVHWLCDEVPRSILSGQPIPPAPDVPSRRRLSWAWRR